MENLITEIKAERNWIRKALGILTYHTMEQARKEDRRGLKWTVQDTAKALQLSVGYISESLLLAKNYPQFKHQFDRTSRDEALKLIRQEKNYGGNQRTGN